MNELIFPVNGVLMQEELLFLSFVKNGDTIKLLYDIIWMMES
jgi:hypothetical protein